MHIFQRQIRVVLDDPLDVICILCDTDRSVLKRDIGTLEQLETVGLRACRTFTRTGQHIGVAGEIQGEVLSFGDGDSCRIRNVLDQRDGLAVFNRCNRIVQRSVYSGTDPGCRVVLCFDGKFPLLILRRFHTARKIAAYVAGEGPSGYCNGAARQAFIEGNAFYRSERTVADRYRSGTSTSTHLRYSRFTAAGEGPSGNRQLTFVHIRIAEAVQDGPLIRVKGSACNRRNIPVQECRLRRIVKYPVLDRQFTPVVILDGIYTSGKGAAVNGKNRRCFRGILIAVIPAVFQ